MHVQVKVYYLAIYLFADVGEQLTESTKYQTRQVRTEIIKLGTSTSNNSTDV